MLHIKYCPKNVSEMVTNLHIVDSISLYLNSNTENQIYMLTGDTGSGKTVAVDLTLRHLKRIKHEINEKLSKQVLHDNVFIWNEYNIKNKVYVFEDCDYDDNIKTLLELNIKSLKIIVIQKSFEKCSKLLKNHLIYNTNINNQKNYLNFIYNIYKNENIKITKKQCNLNICKYKTNIRECINNNSLKDFDSNTNIKSKISNCLNDKSNDNIIKYDSNFSIGYLYESLSKVNNNKKKSELLLNTIYADIFQTKNYVNHNINLEYIHYITHIPYLNTLRSEKIHNINNSNIWSIYSNICTRKQNISKFYVNNIFNFSFINILSVRYHILSIIKNNEDLILSSKKQDFLNKLCVKYKINSSQQLIALVKIFDDDHKNELSTKVQSLCKRILK